MKYKRKICLLISILLIMFNATFLTACFDLGDFEDEQDIYDSFSRVYFINKAFHFDSYPLEDLYSKEVVNDMECNVDMGDYKMMYLIAKEQIKLDDLAFCVYSNKPTSIKWKVFVVDIAPTIQTDEDTGESSIDIGIQKNLASGIVNITGKEFDCENYNQSVHAGAKYNLSVGNCLVVSFENEDLMVNFGITCLLIRKIK